MLQAIRFIPSLLQIFQGFWLFVNLDLCFPYHLLVFLRSQMQRAMTIS